MENYILKAVGIVCVTIVSGILAWRDYEDEAKYLEIIGITIIFIPWDKIFYLFAAWNTNVKKQRFTLIFVNLCFLFSQFFSINFYMQTNFKYFISFFPDQSVSANRLR